MRASPNVRVLAVIYINGLFTIASSLMPNRFTEEIVNLHNLLRRNFAKGSNGAIVSNMGKLAWNHVLERRAQQQLTALCAGTYTHQEQYHHMRSNYKTNSIGNFTGDILSWYSAIDRNYFSPTEGACGPVDSCIHAYTLLNAKHRNIGCAFRPSCQQQDGALLCLYDEINGGEFPFYKTGPVCTRCPDDTPFCEDGLCDTLSNALHRCASTKSANASPNSSDTERSDQTEILFDSPIRETASLNTVACDTSANTCDCRKTCLSPEIGQGVKNNSTCTCTCQYGMGPNCDEPCEDKPMFEDYNPCDYVLDGHCNDPDYSWMDEFCPSKCSCTPFPTDN